MKRKEEEEATNNRDAYEKTRMDSMSSQYLAFNK